MKKLLNIKTVSIILLCLFVSLSSCNQDMTTPAPSIEDDMGYKEEKIEKLDLQGVRVEDGMLVFENYEAMSNIKEKLDKTNFASYKAWCHSIGFKSLAILQNELFDEYAALKNEAEIDLFKQKNSDILTFNDDSSIDMRNPCIHLYFLLNKNSLFKVGTALYRFDEKGEIIVSSGDLYKMNKAIIDRKNYTDVKVYNASKLETRGKCGNQNNTGWINGDSGRRAIVYANIFRDIFEETYLTSKVVTTVLVMTRAQKRTLRIWNDYTTEQSLTWQIQAEIQSPFPAAWGIGPTIIDLYSSKSGIMQDVGFKEERTVGNIQNGQLNRNAVSKFNHIDIFYSNRGGVSFEFHCS